MPLPGQAWIELPLLLELERAGGRTEKSSMYDPVARHFPGITAADLQLMRKDGVTSVWRNSVDWARLSLRKKGELDGGQRGLWEITEQGRQRIRKGLRELGMAETELTAFINSSRTIPEAVGQKWNPSDLARVRNSQRGGGGVAPPPTTKPVEQSIAAGPAAPATPPPTPASAVTASPTRATLQELLEDEHRRLREQLRNRLLALSDTQFEHLCGEVLRAMSLGNIRVTRRSADGGIDGDGVHSALEVKVAFQAKKWQQQVGIPQIRDFKGGVVDRYDRGVFITTSSFSRGAIEEIEATKSFRIIPVDGEKLIDIMIEKGLGVHAVPLSVTQMDEEFFAGLRGG